MPLVITTPRLLLCEGKDDRKVLSDLLYGVADLHVHACDGYPNLKKTLQGLASATGARQLQRLVVVVDSDDDPAARLESLNYARQHYLWPELQSRFVLVPSETQSGALESLYVSDLATPRRRQCIEQMFVCFGTEFQETNRARLDKQRLQVLGCMLHSRREHLLFEGVFEKAAREAGQFAQSFPALEQLRLRLVEALAA